MENTKWQRRDQIRRRSYYKWLLAAGYGLRLADAGTLVAGRIRGLGLDVGLYVGELLRTHRSSDALVAIVGACSKEAVPLRASVVLGGDFARTALGVTAVARGQQAASTCRRSLFASSNAWGTRSTRGGRSLCYRFRFYVLGVKSKSEPKT